MKRYTPLLLLTFLATSCNAVTTPQTNINLNPTPNTNEELALQVPTKKDVDSKSQNDNSINNESTTTLYQGSYFSVAYPKTFRAQPMPLSGEEERMVDEATFTSADGTVEFYVYSPLWGGMPEYLNVATNERQTDIKEETKGDGLEKTVTVWKTFEAKDGSYMRSLVSLRKQVDTGSELHHVFGIKYKDVASYEKYKASYEAFKQSLQQFAD